MDDLNKDPEVERIATLREYHILDTPPDERFDRIARLAAQGTGSPLALISFVDNDRIWFKSVYGTAAVKSTGHEPGFCIKTIFSKDGHIVEDAQNDPDASGNSFVRGALGVRSYAGMPLRSRSGYSLGALCIMDQRPRTFSKGDMLLLSELRELLVDFLEVNRMLQDSAEKERKILRGLAHAIRNPLTIISLQAQILKMEPALSPEISEGLDQIKNAGKKVEAAIYELLPLKEPS